MGENKKQGNSKGKKAVTYPRSVVATRKGYAGGRIREVGDSFIVLKEAHFSVRWMKDAPVTGGNGGDGDFT